MALSVILKPISLSTLNYICEEGDTVLMEFGLSIIYVISHAMWLCWIDLVSNAMRGYGSKIAALFFFLLLCIYEIILNHIWNEYSFYKYLLKLLLVAVVLLENGIFISSLDGPMSRIIGLKSYILRSFGAMVLILCIISMIVHFQACVYKIIVVMIPVALLSFSLHMPRDIFIKSPIWFMRLMGYTTLLLIAYKQQLWVSKMICILFAVVNVTLTISKIMNN